MAWKTEGVITNGGTGDILADTGAQLAGTKTYTFILWSSVGGNIEMAQRNALNTADVEVQRLAVEPNPKFYIFSVPIELVLNQRIVIRVVDPYTGTFQVSILW